MRKLRKAMIGLAMLAFVGTTLGMSAEAAENKGTVSTEQMESEVLKQDDHAGKPEDKTEDGTLKYRLYLPAGYSADEAGGYPVLYLLHGSNKSHKETEWDAFFPTLDEMIADGTIPPVIAVAPVTGDSYWVDSKAFGDYETAIIQDFIPYIDGQYNTRKDREGRILAGFSMGGYGALRYGLIYPDLFSSSILLSPAVQDGEAPATSGAVERGAFNGDGETFDETVWNARNYPEALKSYAGQDNRVSFYILATDDDWNHLSEKEDLPDDAYRYNMEEQAVRLYTALHRQDIFDEKGEFEGNPAQLRIVDGGHDTDPWLLGFRNGLNYIWGEKEEEELAPDLSSADYQSNRKGTVSVEKAPSQSLKIEEEMAFSLYLPYGYEENTETSYPVLYLLHGSWGDERSWNSFWPVLDQMIEQGKIDPVIAVAPITGNSYWVDSEKFGNVESAIMKDLIPYVEEHYRAIPKRAGRALVGYSMGGYGATRYGLTYPETFAAVTLLSPANEDAEAPATSGAVERGAFGEPFDENIWFERNYPQSIARIYSKGQHMVPFYIYAGDDDWNHMWEDGLPGDAYRYNMEVQAVSLYSRLHRQNIFNRSYEKWEDVLASSAELRIVNGGHDTSIWLKGFEEGLMYMFSNGLSGTVGSDNVDIRDTTGLGVKAEGLDRLLRDPGLLTEEEQEALNAGGRLKLNLTLKERSAGSIASASNAIRQQLGSGEKIGKYLDITFEKVITTNDNRVMTAPVATMSNAVKLSFTLPKAMQDQGSYHIYRYHQEDGQAEVDELSQDPEQEEYFFTDGVTMTLYSKKYSIFAIAYTEKEKTPGHDENDDSEDRDASPAATNNPGKWILDEKGWWYQFTNGGYAANGWYSLEYGGKTDWYYFGLDGYMRTGWLTDVYGRRYYLQEKADGTRGKMLTGWQQIGDGWYYFETRTGGMQGALYVQARTPDGYQVDENGRWVEQ